MLLFSFVLSLTILLTSWVEASDYHEQLLLRPLPQSALLAAFNFRSNTTATAFEQQNFRYFPRSLGQILQHTHTKELHLRFALGRWDAEAWGARPRGGHREGGTGVELWAWIDAATDEEANARWLTLTNALSGLFCASMNFIDSTKTIRPVSTFQQEGDHSRTSPENLHLLHGALPHEVVCTENLTPFLKLLPCKGKAGISSLLDGHKLFDASWQTMAIDVRPVCPADGSECLLEIDQTVDMVLDIERSMRPSHDPIPRPLPIENIKCNTSKPYNGPDTCFPEDQTGILPAWSLKEVYGRPIRGSCPLTDDSAPTVILEVPEGRDVRGESAESFTQSREGNLRLYQLPKNADFDLTLREQSLDSSLSLEQPPVYASRTFTGQGQERGGMLAVLTNPSPSTAVSVIYLESSPWFMKPYLHTLQASISGSDPNVAMNPLDSVFYRPSIDRQRGTHLELALTIPAASTVTLTYAFEKAILRYTEYPPDANRGFDVAPAIIRVLPFPSTSNSTSLPPQSYQEGSTYLRTTSLLLPLPTPDFSMPYNVIILTSTVIAMGFGSVFNLLVRRFVGADEVEGPGLAGLKARVKGRIQALLARFGGGGEKKHQ